MRLWQIPQELRSACVANGVKFVNLMPVDGSRAPRYMEVWAESGGTCIVLRLQRGDPISGVHEQLATICWPGEDPEFMHIISVTAEGPGCGAAVNCIAVVGKDFVEWLLKPEVRMEQTDRKGTVTVHEPGTVARLTGRAREAFAAEWPTTMWMVAARKAIDRTAPLAIDALVRGKIVKPDTAKILRAWIKSEVGSGAYGYLAGSLLTMHPKVANRPWLAELAKHMRLEGGARIVGSVVDPLLSAVEAVLIGAVEETGIDVEESDK